MPIRVAHIGTGNVGRLALTGVITNPAYELTAVGVSSEAKVGKDAGELAGVGVSTGIAATGELEAVQATRLRAVLGDGRQPHGRGDGGLPADPVGGHQLRRLCPGSAAGLECGKGCAPVSSW